MARLHIAERFGASVERKNGTPSVAVEGDDPFASLGTDRPGLPDAVRYEEVLFASTWPRKIRSQVCLETQINHLAASKCEKLWQRLLRAGGRVG